MVAFLIFTVFCIACIAVCGMGLWGTFLLITSRGFSTAPTVAASGPAKKAILDGITEQLMQSKKTQTVMDLGSGFGTFLLPLARQFPQHQFVGYEWSILPFFISRFRARKLKNITFYRKDLFTADIHQANVIILFLIPSLMPRVEKKCLAECPKNTVIFSRFAFPEQKPIQTMTFKDVFKTVFVYKLSRKK